MSYFEKQSEEHKRKLLAKFGRTPETFCEDVEVIKDWFSKQKHLPEIPCDKRIEASLLLSKCQIENDKRKWDMYYTLRQKMPEFCLNPNEEPMKSYTDHYYYVPIPRPMEDGGRVIVMKLDDNPNFYDPVLCFAWILNVVEIMMCEGFACDVTFITDCAGWQIGHYIKTSPMVLKRISTFSDKVHKASIKGIHFLNPPPFIDKVLFFVKSFVKEKVEGRIHVHKSLSSLQEQVPKELLPSEFGGSQKSSRELHEMLKRKMVEYKDHYDRMDTWEVNEQLRAGPPVDDDELFGSYGNFKKLDLD